MKISVGITLVFFSLFVASVNATVVDARDIVKNTSDKVISRLLAEKEYLQAHPERIYDLIQELVVPHFDFPIMSKWVLGKAWKTISEEQQQRFIEEFKTLLVRTYAKALQEYSQQEIKYLTPIANPNSNLIVVKTEVLGVGGASGVPINYRMHISGGEWKVIDIAVDGVSLIGTYRGSFASEIRKNGLNSLINKLIERNERLLTTVTQ